MAGSLALAFDVLLKDRASPELDNLSRSFGRASAAGTFLGTIAGQAVAKGLGLIKDAASSAIGQIGSTVTAASDLSESVSKAERVFGPAAAGIEAFGDTAAKSLGLSKQAAIESAATFGNLFTSLQIDPSKSAQMSKTLVGLAGDLASFNNVDTSTALDALKSGLLGEAEPLRQFGVTLSEARIQAEALADGLVKPAVSSDKLKDAQTTLALATERARIAIKDNGATSAQAVAANQQVERASQAVAKAVQGQVAPLTASQKAQAALNIIMKDTATAQGDFSRTSGGLANQQRILSANFEDVRAKIGEALLPKITELAQYVNSDVVPAVLGFIDGMKQGTGTGGQFADVLGSLADATKTAFDLIKPLVEFVVSNGGAFSTIAIGAAALAGGFKLIAAYTKLRGLLFGIAEGEAAAGAAGGTAAIGVKALATRLATLIPLAIAAGQIPGSIAQTKTGNDAIAANLKKAKDAFDAGTISAKEFQEIQRKIIDDSVKLGVDKTMGPVSIPAYDKLLNLINNPVQSTLTAQRRRQLEDALRGDDPKAAARARAELEAARTTTTRVATTVVKTFKDTIPTITPSIADAIKAGEQAAVDAAQAVVDRIKERFDTAKSKLAETVQAALNFRKEIATALTQGSGLTDVFGSGVNLNANGAFGGHGGDFERIKTFLQARLERIRRFTVELRQLLARGLRQDLVAQIAQAGVDGGERIAQGLLAGGPAGIRSINSLTGSISRTADSTGRILSDNKFEALRRAQEHQTEVLHRQLALVNRNLELTRSLMKAGTSAPAALIGSSYGLGGA